MEKRNELAFQDYYPDSLSHCFGCGKLNDHGMKLKSYWDADDGDSTVAYFKPEPYQLSMPGFVSGGLIASLIDCHGTGTASAAGYKFEKRELGSSPYLRYVTASLKVDFKSPTPMGEMLTLKGVVEEIKAKKVVVKVTVHAKDKICATGIVIAVRIPDEMKMNT